VPGNLVDVPMVLAHAQAGSVLRGRRRKKHRIFQKLLEQMHAVFNDSSVIHHFFPFILCDMMICHSPRQPRPAQIDDSLRQV